MMSPTAHVLLTAAERRKECWRLRLAGNSYREIADATGLSMSTVQRALQRAYQEYKTQCEHDATETARVDLARLDKVIKALEPAVLAGDTKAATQIIRALDQRARRLGHYAPDKLEVSTPYDTMSPEQIQALAQQRGIVIDTTTQKLDQQKLETSEE